MMFVRLILGQLRTTLDVCHSSSTAYYIGLAFPADIGRKPAPPARGSRESLHAGESRREPARAGESRREPARAGESRREPARAGESRREPARAGESRREPASPVTRTRRLMKRRTAQHGGARMERDGYA